MRHNADFWIIHLRLIDHVEGGAFRETYRSSLMTPKSVLPEGFKGDRNISTAIYFLLKEGQFSAFHRIASDEMWHFYYGDTLEVFEITSSGKLITHRLGNNPGLGESFQCVVSAGSWFGSKIVTGGEYSLVGCTVSPGFDFNDFELADRDELTKQYPQYTELIKQLTKSENAG